MPPKRDRRPISLSGYVPLRFPMTEGAAASLSMPETLFDKGKLPFGDVARMGFAERMQMDVKLSDPKWISVL